MKNKSFIYLSIFLMLANQSVLAEKKIYLALTDASGMENSKAEQSIDQLATLLKIDDKKSIKSLKENFNFFNKNKKVEINNSIAEYSILLKNTLPKLCNNLEKENNTQTPFFEKELVLSDDLNKIIKNDIETKNNENKVEINNYIMLLLIVSQLACEAEKTKNSSIMFDEKLEAANIQKGSMKVIDFSNPNDETLQTIAKESGINPQEWKAEQEKIHQDLLKNGFTEVDKNELVNLDSIYEKYKNELSIDLNDVKKKLSFSPLGNITNPTFKIIGAEAAGALTEKGFSDLSLIYDSPYGKIQVIESDLQSNQGMTFIPSFAFNEKIGIYDAAILVKKANNSNTFETSVYWNNFNQKRDYTVVINKNLNDKNLQKERDYILKTLSTSYGNQ